MVRREAPQNFVARFIQLGIALWASAALAWPAAAQDEPTPAPGAPGAAVTPGAADEQHREPALPDDPSVWPVAPGQLAFDDPSLRRLTAMSLEDLMNLKVTSVTGLAGEWFDSPAAVYVITGEEVRRSGHRSIPEALRLGPGVFVGQIGSHRWAIGTRGFNGDFANKTLVMIDGRSVYTPLFGGTFWDVQDILLEDLDRIEVIRGPGPTLWGANAVNGVFSITTRSARETQGLYLTAGAGTPWENAFGGVRYGGRIDDHTWFRVWGKAFDRGPVELPGPEDFQDDWAKVHGGFRIDRNGADNAKIMLQGAAYSANRLGEVRRVPVPGMTLVFEDVVADGRAHGGHLLFRVDQDEPDDSGGWSFQTYYDRTERTEFSGFEESRDTFDAEFRHHFHPFDDHELLWGVGARYTTDRTDDGLDTLIDPDERDFATFSAFIQDTITLVDDELFAMIGTKLEHNSYTGFEVQPSARMWWTPNDQHTLWAAVSRAVRVPTRVERDGTFIFAFADTGLVGGGPPSGVVVPFALTGNRDADSEVLIAYEAGYRIAPTPDLNFDFTIFYNDYRTILFAGPDAIGPFSDDGTAESYGAEAVAKWQVSPNWRLVAAYSFVDMHVHNSFHEPEGDAPHHQAQLRSYLDVTDDVDLNAALYYVDNVPNQNAGDYLRLDVGVTWRPDDQVEISVWGQNLLDDAHAEFGRGPQVERGVYGQITFRF
jgi:iron complex outermembrane receptor protein